ncbi:MAG TPA: type II secretion system protein GspC [Kofleriaceae bacterium]|nr:type II secretion system protein GspC [Kofleriaceae bacterium]
MQDLVKRHFWVLGAVAVLVCSVFAAKATSHVIEAKFLGDSSKTPRVQPVIPSPMQQPAKQARSKDGGQFASRNMFCSDCTPPVVVATSSDPSQIQTTSLPLQLLATMVATKAEDSYATIVNTENQKQGAYAIGDPIPGATGKIKEIHYKYIDFENSGHTERLVLVGATAPVTTPVAAAEPAPASDGGGDELQAAIDNGIKKIDDNNYEIDKALVDKVLANPMGVAKGARVVPAVKNGQPDGFKLYAIRPSSVYAKLGLANGDTLQSINGFELTSADKALEVYTKLREATALEVQVTRRGKPVTLKYSIR